MNTNTAEQQLHDRATRGELLTVEERTLLDAWYARLDQEEGLVLARAVPPVNLVTLQAQIENTLEQIAALSQRNQTLTAENAAVRQEVASLKLLLAQKLTPQST